MWWCYPQHPSAENKSNKIIYFLLEFSVVIIIFHAVSTLGTDFAAKIKKKKLLKIIQEHREDLSLGTDQVLHPLEAGLPPEPEESEGPVEAASHRDGAEQREHDEGLLER